MGQTDTHAGLPNRTKAGSELGNISAFTALSAKRSKASLSSRPGLMTARGAGRVGDDPLCPAGCAGRGGAGAARAQAPWGGAAGGAVTGAAAMAAAPLSPRVGAGAPLGVARGGAVVHRLQNGSEVSAWTRARPRRPRPGRGGGLGKARPGAACAACAAPRACCSTQGAASGAASGAARGAAKGPRQGERAARVYTSISAFSTPSFNRPPSAIMSLRTRACLFHV